MKMRTAILVGVVCLALGVVIGMALRPAPIMAAGAQCVEGQRMLRLNDTTFAAIGSQQVYIYGLTHNGWKFESQPAPQ